MKLIETKRWQLICLNEVHSVVRQRASGSMRVVSTTKFLKDLGALQDTAVEMLCRGAFHDAPLPTKIERSAAKVILGIQKFTEGHSND